MSKINIYPSSIGAGVAGDVRTLAMQGSSQTI